MEFNELWKDSMEIERIQKKRKKMKDLNTIDT